MASKPMVASPIHLCRKYPSSVVTVLLLYAGGGVVTTSYNRQVLLQWLTRSYNAIATAAVRRVGSGAIACRYGVIQHCFFPRPSLPHFHCLSLVLFISLLVYIFSMDTPQPKSICECGREFDKPVGLSIHQRTCKTKAAEKERDARYERELAESRKEKTSMCPNILILPILYHIARCCCCCHNATTLSTSMGGPKAPRKGST